MNTDQIILAPSNPTAALSPTGRYLILVVAFLGWLCAGVHMSITQLAGQPAAIDLLQRADADRASLTQGEATVGRWFAWYQCAFLFGAATGGLVFGRLG